MAVHIRSHPGMALSGKKRGKGESKDKLNCTESEDTSDIGEILMKDSEKKKR